MTTDVNLRLPRFLLTMRNVSDKICRENQNTPLCPTNFFNNTIYELMCKTFVESNMPRLSIWHNWIPKSTNKHSEYVILIAFPLQQWLNGCVSMFCDTYIFYLAIFNFIWDFLIFFILFLKIPILLSVADFRGCFWLDFEAGLEVFVERTTILRPFNPWSNHYNYRLGYLGQKHKLALA
jgi:hypothetical protein